MPDLDGWKLWKRVHSSQRSRLAYDGEWFGQLNKLFNLTLTTFYIIKLSMKRGPKMACEESIIYHKYSHIS